MEWVLNPSGGVFTIVQSGFYSDTQALWVAVGRGPSVGAIATSTNGLTWTDRPSHPWTVAGNTVRHVAYSKALNLWVATGQKSNLVTIASSPDAITWTQRYQPATPASALPSYLNWIPELSLWLCSVGCTTATSPATTITSSDGITWTQHFSIFTSGTSPTAQGFGWNGSMLVIVGGPGSGTIVDTLATSTDGLAFTGQGKTVFSAIAAVGSVDNAGGVAYSNITRTWAGTALGAVATNIVWSNDGLNWIITAANVTTSSNRLFTTSGGLNIFARYFLNASVT
jgi:hypothetical protein